MYEQLTNTVRGFERAGCKTKKGDPVFYSFRREMKLVDRDGRGVAWAWVRNKNMKAFMGKGSTDVWQGSVQEHLGRGTGDICTVRPWWCLHVYQYTS